MAGSQLVVVCVICAGELGSNEVGSYGESVVRGHKIVIANLSELAPNQLLKFRPWWLVVNW